MGRTYHFECPLCHYRADLSGGTDGGLHCEIQTVSCSDCRKLYDVFTKLRRKADDPGRPPKFPGFFRPEIPPVILRDGKNSRLIWQKFIPSCPVEAKHLVEPWKDPGRCPRCGNFMEKSGIAFRLWD